jgi:nucleoid-associated protein YgaU
LVIDNFVHSLDWAAAAAAGAVVGAATATAAAQAAATTAAAQATAAQAAAAQAAAQAAAAQAAAALAAQQRAAGGPRRLFFSSHDALAFMLAVSERFKDDYPGLFVAVVVLWIVAMFEFVWLPYAKRWYGVAAAAVLGWWRHWRADHAL